MKQHQTFIPNVPYVPMLHLQCAVISSRILLRPGALRITEPFFTRLTPHNDCLFRRTHARGLDCAKHPEQHQHTLYPTKNQLYQVCQHPCEAKQLARDMRGDLILNAILRPASNSFLLKSCNQLCTTHSMAPAARLATRKYKFHGLKPRSQEPTKPRSLRPQAQPPVLHRGLSKQKLPTLKSSSSQLRFKNFRVSVAGQFESDGDLGERHSRSSVLSLPGIFTIRSHSACKVSVME
jgi:hypothetical protein